MLGKITLLTSLLFSCLYPLFLWIHVKDPLKNHFHHFHTALPNIIGGIVVVFLWLGPYPELLSRCAAVWIIAALLVTAFYWGRECVQPLVVSLVSLSGLFIYYNLQSFIFTSDVLTFFISILGGLIFCGSLYAMNLGHWYLNVHGLPIKHLKNTANVFWLFLLMRFIWDLYALAAFKIEYVGDMIPYYRFIFNMDGILLLVAIFFGTIFPFFAMFMVREILKLKNTQATTGVLYVILCAVMLGDIAYKYYLIKYGILL